MLLRSIRRWTSPIRLHGFRVSAIRRSRETIVLHAGDTRQADFHLVPIPSIHMRILTPPRVGNGATTAPATFPIIQQVNSGGGGPNFVQISTLFDQQGQVDVGGLTPGLYQVRLAGPESGGPCCTGRGERELGTNAGPERAFAGHGQDYAALRWRCGIGFRTRERDATAVCR